MQVQNFNYNIFNLKTEKDFLNKSLEIFKMQALHVPAYKKFIDYLNIEPQEVTNYTGIPFIPVELFKYHKILHDKYAAEMEFVSSGTGGTANSYHYIADTSLYISSILHTFTSFFGRPADYCILALLPSYLERGNSSLVFMADLLIRESGHPQSGFYLYNYENLIKTIEKLKAENKKTLLIGVSFALLEIAEKYSPDFSGLIVMETGGMKGKRKEMVREELHGILKEKLNVSVIHSEYGMTELLSQSYSTSGGFFQSPPWMKILIRDPYDPMTYLKEGQNGAINIIDLANIYSCSFIATSDMGRLIPGKGFEISGRLDNSDIRGCNLLIA